MLTLLQPKNNSKVDTYTKIQSNFLRKVKEYNIKTALDYLVRVKKDKERSFPKPIKLSWTNDDSKEYILNISEDKDFNSVTTYKTNKTYFYLFNLKIGQKYYWQVNNSKVFTFETVNKGYRFIKVNGAINVRDVGGIKIKQGIIFRGSEIEEEFMLTKKGINIFENELKIKSVICLREELSKDHTYSNVCKSVRRVRLPYRPYLEVFEEKRRANIRDIMEYLANEDVYPLYFHCKGGADRTGMIALFLRALAGETEDEIFTDYELTSLSTYGAVLDKRYGVIITETTGFRRRTDSYFVEFINELNKYNGITLNERIKNFLLDCGIKLVTLDKISKIIKS